MNKIVLSKNDHKKKFEAVIGDLIVISLKEIPSTGYRWKVDAIEDQVIDIQGSSFSIAPTTGIGGGGTRTFTFKTESSGLANIKLILSREWEPKNSAIDYFEVTIHVKGG